MNGMNGTFMQHIQLHNSTLKLNNTFYNLLNRMSFWHFSKKLLVAALPEMARLGIVPIYIFT